MATKISITNLPVGYQSIITNGTHSIVGDEPVRSRGTDLGLAPSELVLAGLAMCKAATVRHVARRKGWDIGNVDAQLEQVVKRGENRNLAANVRVAIQIDGDITEEQREELLREADACYIHRLLDGEWNIDTAVDSLEEIKLAS